MHRRPLPAPGVGCTAVRALAGPGPFLGSRAVAIDPKGRNVYVASSQSNAIAVFRRNARTGRLTQASAPPAASPPAAPAGARERGRSSAPTRSPSARRAQRLRHLAATATRSAVFLATATTGALTQPRADRRLRLGRRDPRLHHRPRARRPRRRRRQPRRRNVYVGSFAGNAVAVLARNASSGALTQPAGTAGCIGGAAAGCAPGVALGRSGGPGDQRRTATRSTSRPRSATPSARAGARPSTGALTQATDGTGCIVKAPLAGCTRAPSSAGANAVAVSPDDGSVYVTSLIEQQRDVVHAHGDDRRTRPEDRDRGLRGVPAAIGCSLGRAMNAPEGLAVSPDGASVYVGRLHVGRDRHARPQRADRARSCRSRAGRAAGHRRGSADCTLGRALSRRELDGGQPRRPQSLLDGVLERRGRRLHARDARELT